MGVSFKTDNSGRVDDNELVFDRDWVKSTFIIKDSDIVLGDEYSKWIRINRYFSTADNKFTCTSPGLNISVNPKPQFTRYCDIRSPGKLNRENITLQTTSSENGLGMGRYYSEAIDDNQQRIYLRFGVPKYMPLLLWIYKSFDVNKVVLMNRGVITTALIESVGIVARFFAIAAAPLFALGMFAANVITQNSRFYSVKETMYVYWATVENILNQMVARRTMIPYILQDYTAKLDNTMNREQKPNANFVENLNKLLPEIIDGETGRISIFALALRAQSAFNKMKADDVKRNESYKLNSDFTGYKDTGNTTHDTYFTNSSGRDTLFTRYIFNTAYNLLMKDDKSQSVNLDDPKKSPTQGDLIEFDTTYTDNNGEFVSHVQTSDDPKDSVDARIISNIQSKKDKFENYKKYLMAEFSEGAAFAIFNVENTGSIGESFNNSFGQNPVESIFNSLSAKSRNITDILSSGSNIPIVGDVLKLAADAGATVLSNASFGVANPLLALAYGVNISMPKIWESSAASLPRASYKMKLISPYGNAYSQLFNIYVPLAMILAGSLPRSTGKSTHTFPFFCQLFDRGRTNIQVGMIESVALTRGTSNLAFSRNGHPNSIDVDLSIANLDEILSVDVNDSGVIGKIGDALNPDFTDTPFVSYLNTITGVDVYSQIYQFPAIRLKLAARYAELKSVIQPDPAAFGSFTVNTIPGFKFLLQGTISDNAGALQDLIQK